MSVGSREGSQQTLLEYRKCQHFPAIYWLIHAVFSGWGFLGMLNTTVKFRMTSLPVFVSQTGSALIFQPVIDWFTLLSRGEGFLGCGTPWWSQKCRYFLFCSPNRKCQRFPACNWLICAVFSGRRFLWMRNTMVKPKMSLLPVLLTKQEVPAFSCL